MLTTPTVGANLKFSALQGLALVAEGHIFLIWLQIKLCHFKMGWNGKTNLRSHELWGATTVDWHISLTLDYNNNMFVLLFVVCFFFGLYSNLTSSMNWSKSPECPLPDQSQLSSLENWTPPWKLAFSNVIWFDQTHRLTQTMLFGLMSRWMMSLSCMNTIPETTCSQEDWLIKNYLKIRDIKFLAWLGLGQCLKKFGVVFSIKEKD